MEFVDAHVVLVVNAERNASCRKRALQSFADYMSSPNNNGIDELADTFASSVKPDFLDVNVGNGNLKVIGNGIRTCLLLYGLRSSAFVLLPATCQ